MKSKIGLILLVSIVLLGIFLRFYKLQTNFIFGMDQSEDMFNLVKIYNTLSVGDLGNLPIIGEPGTYRGGNNIPIAHYPVYSGVFFLYLILPFATLGSFRPENLVILFALANTLSIPVMYLAGKELFNKKVGIISALLFSVSLFMNVYSRAIWTPSFVPCFVIGALYLFILIKKKKMLGLWPPFLFLISAASQVHDSGYYYMFLFILFIIFLKPEWPKKISTKILSLTGFFLPLIPTIIYEIKTGFALVPTIINAFLYQFGKSYSADSSDLFIIISKTFFSIFQRFWEFWVSGIDPLHFDNFYEEHYGILNQPILLTISFLAILSLVNIYYTYKKNRDAGKIFIIFLATFLIVPFFTKLYYLDTYKGLIPLFGTIFAAVGAIPFQILIVGSFLGSVWERKSKFSKFLVIGLLFLLGAINIFLVKFTIWQNGDQRYDYGQKIEIVRRIFLDSENKKYDLNFKDLDEPGFEYLYLFSMEKIPQPVSYNGKAELQTFFYTYEFSTGKSEVSYLILGRPYWKEVKNDVSWEKLYETGRFRLFKKEIKK